MNTKNGISAEISLIPGNERGSRLGPRLAIREKHSPMSELFSAHMGEAITSASLALLGEEGTEVELQISKCEQGSAAMANATHLLSSAGDFVPRAAPLLLSPAFLSLL